METMERNYKQSACFKVTQLKIWGKRKKILLKIYQKLIEFIETFSSLSTDLCISANGKKKLKHPLSYSKFEEFNYLDSITRKIVHLLPT